MLSRKTTAFLCGALLIAGASQVRGQTLSLAAAPAPSQMLERTATVTLKVPNYDAASHMLQRDALAEGAEVMDQRTAVDEKGHKHGWVRLQAPQEHLAPFLADLNDVGKLYAQNIETTDNLSEYEELARRVGRLQQHEGRLNGVLQSSHRLRGSDILFLQERLFRASVDDSLLQQQRVDLERGIQTSSLTVVLFEPLTLPSPAPSRHPVNLQHQFTSAVRWAHTALNLQMARGMTAGAYALVFAPLWLPLLLICLGLLWWLGRKSRIIYTRLVALARPIILLIQTRWSAKGG